MIGNSRHGFTLVEAVVAAAISSILITSVVGLFVNFQKIQNSSHDELSLQTYARQVINTMTEQLRAGYIDYSYYSGAPSAEPQYLATRTPTGDQTVLEFYNAGSGTNLYICKKTFSGSCAKGVDPSVNADWTQLNSSDVYFSQGVFYIQPSSAQFYTSSTSDNPQLVTVRMQLTTKADVSPEVSNVIQTTLTPRVYGR